MERNQVKERAESLVEKDVFFNATSLVNRALESYGEWESAGYYYDSATNIIEEDEDGETRVKEVFQWWAVSDVLAHWLEEDGQVVLTTDDGCYWGRTGYGYALYIDFLDIAEKLLR